MKLSPLLPNTLKMQVVYPDDSSSLYTYISILYIYIYTNFFIQAVKHTNTLTKYSGYMCKHNVSDCAHLKTRHTNPVGQ